MYKGYQDHGKMVPPLLKGFKELYVNAVTDRMTELKSAVPSVNWKTKMTTPMSAQEALEIPKKTRS